jgi:hypothetical protein
MSVNTCGKGAVMNAVAVGSKSQQCLTGRRSELCSGEKPARMPFLYAVDNEKINCRLFDSVCQPIRRASSG